MDRANPLPACRQQHMTRGRVVCYSFTARTCTCSSLPVSVHQRAQISFSEGPLERDHGWYQRRFSEHF